MMTTTETTGITWTRVEGARQLSTAFKSMYVLTNVGAGLAMGIEGPLLHRLFALGGLLSWALIVASFVVSQRSTREEGVVDVTDTALLVRPARAHSRSVDRTSIVGALVVERPVPGGLAYEVEVETAGGDRLTIGTSDLGAARALVDRLGFGPGGARVRSRLTTPGRRFLHLPIALGAYVFFTVVMTALAFGLMGGLAGATLAAFTSPATLLVYTLVKRLVAPPEVVIGDDGVRVERGWGARFYKVGDPKLFGALRGVGLDDLRVASILRRAEERVAAGGMAASGAFARGERSLEDWRRRLAAMFEGGYRASPKTAEEAASVLRSAAAAPDERVGAAMALRVAGDTERVRAAARGTADERVRIALEAVADEGDDAAIDKALRRMASR